MAKDVGRGIAVAVLSIIPGSYIVGAIAAFGWHEWFMFVVFSVAATVTGALILSMYLADL